MSVLGHANRRVWAFGRFLFSIIVLGSDSLWFISAPVRADRRDRDQPAKARTLTRSFGIHLVSRLFRRNW